MMGICNLTNHADLFKKLEWEYAALMQEPNNGYLAFNFFVTAWHLLEWKYPGSDNKSARKVLQQAEPLLGICKDLAVGVRHLEPRARHDVPIPDSQAVYMWKTGVWTPGTGQKSSWGSWLVVPLAGNAKKIYGKAISVEDLATRVMEYWKSSFYKCAGEVHAKGARVKGLNPIQCLHRFPKTSFP